MSRASKHLRRAPSLAGLMLVISLLVSTSVAAADEAPAASPKTEATVRIAFPRSPVAFAVQLEDAHQASQLEPNREDTRTVRFEGNLPANSELQVWRADPNRGPDDPHACLRAFYGDQELGHSKANAVTVQGPESTDRETHAEAQLTLRVDHDCGWLEDARIRAVPVVFSHKDSGAGQQVQWQYVLRNPLELEYEVTLEVKRGQAPKTYAWGPKWTSDQPRSFQVTLDLESAATELPKGLSIRVRNQDSLAESDTAADAQENDSPAVRDTVGDVHTYSFMVSRDDNQPPLLLEVEADACTHPGTYAVPLRLASLHEDGTVGRPRTILMMVEVTGNSLRCWLPRFALGAAILALISLLSGGYHRRVKGRK